MIRKTQKSTTAEEEVQIVQMYTSGMTQKEIGAIHNVSQGAVSNILKRKGVRARSKTEASSRKYHVDHHYFDSIDTPDKAYWLGFIAADGNIDRNCLSIKLNRVDRNHLVLFMQCIGSSASVIDGTNNIGVDYSLARVFSAFISSSLLRHGITKNKTWAVTPWCGSADMMPHYWRGVIDGDGWISAGANGLTERFYTVGLCGNYEMVNGFGSYINSVLGYNNSVVTKKLKSEKPFGQIAYTGTHRAKNICEHLLYGGKYIALTRKNESAIKIMSFVSTEKEQVYVTDDIARLIADEYKTGLFSCVDLAKKYNVGKGTINNIANKKGRFAFL